MLNVTTHSNTPDELAIKDQLAEILDRTDTSRYWFTRDVVIEQGALPHSHPVLTLGTRAYTDENLLLADFVHEQLHWHLVDREDDMHAAVADVRSMYDDVPVGHPDGGHDEFSTYLHLVLCPLEHVVLVDLVGADAAEAVRRFWQSDHYRWVYRTVESDWERLLVVIQRHELDPSGP
jgi:hypothetical protein